MADYELGVTKVIPVDKLVLKIRNSYTVDELAHLIRPCIGLTRGQTSAARNFYDNLLKNLTEQHPRTKPETLQARALDRTMKYAERLHRQRAMTIAQTEMAYAYNYGADEGIRQAQEDFLIGKCVKRWCTSGDENVCEECDKLDGTEVGMEETFFSGNKVEYDESGLFPPLHPRCACAIEYIEVEPPNYDLQRPSSGGSIDSENGLARQEGIGVDIPERYVGDFSDYEPLNLTKEESAALSELNALALQTGAEHGRGFIDGVPQEVFTSNEHNRIFIPATLTGSSSVKIFHSHTNCTPFSAADLAWLTNPSVDMIGVISSNGDVYTAAIGGGYLIDFSEFKEVADGIADRVDLELINHPDFFDWTVEERKYMAIKEQMFQIARQFGWTLRGGRL